MHFVPSSLGCQFGPRHIMPRGALDCTSPSALGGMPLLAETLGAGNANSAISINEIKIERIFSMFHLIKNVLEVVD